MVYPGCTAWKLAPLPSLPLPLFHSIFHVGPLPCNSTSTLVNTGAPRADPPASENPSSKGWRELQIFTMASESTTTTASFYDLVRRDPPIPSQGDSKDPELLKQLTKQGKGLKVVDDEQQKMSDMLNAMLPPREFEHGGTTWIQRTGTDVPSREDVKALRGLVRPLANDSKPPYPSPKRL